MTRRWCFLLFVVVALLAACGTPAPATREAELGATIAALEATIVAGEPTAPREPSPEATTTVAATTEHSAVASSGAVTTIMRELTVAGEPFATEGDPNAPLTIIEFSDYG